jgi:GNAT superfamily N-acetyltransferase
MGLTPVPDGHVAAVVTTLEMRRRPPLRPMPDSHLRLAAWDSPAPEKYRTLFARVGAPWLWFSRLTMDDATLGAIIGDPDVSVLAVVDRQGIEVGLLELDYRVAGECELSFVGLVPELTGDGHGRWLMAEALNRAWRKGVERVWMHTCSLDHPSALGFYRASGFTPISRAVETFPDPRLTGHLSRDAAPQVPIIG